MHTCPRVNFVWHLFQQQDTHCTRRRVARYVGLLTCYTDLNSNRDSSRCFSRSFIIFVIAFVSAYMQTRRCERNDYDIIAELSIAMIVHLNIPTLTTGRLRVPIGLLFAVVPTWPMF
jgi:hypothetical protein